MPYSGQGHTEYGEVECCRRGVIQAQLATAENTRVATLHACDDSERNLFAKYITKQNICNKNSTVAGNQKRH